MQLIDYVIILLYLAEYSAEYYLDAAYFSPSAVTPVLTTFIIVISVGNLGNSVHIPDIS